MDLISQQQMLELLSQPQIGFPLPDFPKWYTNNPDNKWKAGSWEEYTDAAEDQLDVVESVEGFISLQKRENSASTPCIEDLVSSDFRYNKKCDIKECVYCVVPYSKLTHTDLENFRLQLSEAEMDLQLFDDYFTPDGKHAMLQHDSTVENVVSRLPLMFAKNTRGPRFPTFLKRLIYMAKQQHEMELCRDYNLFLTKCDCIKSDTTEEECLEMLKDDLANKFGDLDSDVLLRDMRSYLDYRKVRGDISEYNAGIQLEYQQEQNFMWKARSRFPGELMTPIHFLAFQKRRKGYRVQHTVKEIMKFRAYFGLFLNGVPLPWHHEPQSPEPSQASSSP